MTTSDIGPISPCKSNAELTQSALYASHYSVGEWDFVMGEPVGVLL
jgi:hypothetical protein